MIPPKTHALWGELLTATMKLETNSFALKMMLSRLRSTVTRDGSPATRQKCVEEVHEFFVRHEELLRNEVKELFGGSSEAAR